MFQHKKVVIATKHAKEQVIKPVFEKIIGCNVIVPADYDTDLFGTFTGEIERKLPPNKMVIEKAKIAMDRYGFDYGIASEGSFGPHPLIPFSPLHQELLAFVDRETGLSITVEENTTDTNYAFLELKKGEVIEPYLAQLKFPSHAIIVRALSDNKVIAKGIDSLDELLNSTNKAFEISPVIRLESDMRALYNPTRMKVIEKLAYNLAERIQSTCPRCHSWGFGKLQPKGNLSCEYCEMPTQLYQHYSKSCIQCDYYEMQPRPDGLVKAKQTYCQYCNP